eukprot:gene8670-biopygen7641
MFQYDFVEVDEPAVSGKYVRPPPPMSLPPPSPPPSPPPQHAGSPPPAATAGSAVTIFIAHHQCPRRLHPSREQSRRPVRAMNPAAPQQHEGSTAAALGVCTAHPMFSSMIFITITRSVGVCHFGNCRIRTFLWGIRTFLWGKLDSTDWDRRTMRIEACGWVWMKRLGLATPVPGKDPQHTGVGFLWRPCGGMKVTARCRVVHKGRGAGAGCGAKATWVNPLRSAAGQRCHELDEHVLLICDRRSSAGRPVYSYLEGLALCGASVSKIPLRQFHNSHAIDGHERMGLLPVRNCLPRVAEQAGAGRRNKKVPPGEGRGVVPTS